MRDPTHEIDVLNDLLEHASDSYECYREAQERITEPTVQEFLTQRVGERRRVLCNLRHVVQALGARPVLGGTVIGSARRLLMELRAHLTDTESTLLAELEYCDEQLREQLEGALVDFRLCTPVREAMNETLAEIHTSLVRLREFKTPSLPPDLPAEPSPLP